MAKVWNLHSERSINYVELSKEETGLIPAVAVIYLGWLYYTTFLPICQVPCAWHRCDAMLFCLKNTTFIFGHKFPSLSRITFSKLENSSILNSLHPIVIDDKYTKYALFLSWKRNYFEAKNWWILSWKMGMGDGATCNWADLVWGRKSHNYRPMSTRDKSGHRKQIGKRLIYTSADNRGTVWRFQQLPPVATCKRSKF